ncbi:MAG: NnrS family protein [Candidatus Thermoplasmatota archaeon]|nr:NnrS family protein [Candidatus Thermoplasmatota archaeon]
MPEISRNRKAVKPLPIVYAGILLSVVSLALGLLTGIAALAENNGYYINAPVASGILFHPDLMIFGVVGGLLITEKLELMEKFPLAGRLPISRPILVMLFAGVFSTSIAILYNLPFLRYVGLILVMASSLLFLYYMTSSRNPGQRGIKQVFGAAIFAMALSAFSNMGFVITGNTGLTYLALLFPVIYVLAERMELGFVRGMKSRTTKIQVYVSWVAVISAFVSAESNALLHYAAMYVSIAFIGFLIAVSVLYDPTFHGARRKNRFQNFMRTGVIISYLWLILGLLLFTAQLIAGHGFLDPAAHSIALGFIGTFIVAHSPVIFPLTLKKKANQENVSYLPLVILTIANVMRVFGDLLAPFAQVGYTISYISGFVILIAIVAFIYNLRRIMGSLDPVHKKQHSSDEISKTN